MAGFAKGVDKAGLARIADGLVVAVAVALPWSTSATTILVVPAEPMTTTRAGSLGEAFWWRSIRNSRRVLVPDRSAERVVNQLRSLHADRIENGVWVYNNAARESAGNILGSYGSIFSPRRED